MVKVLDILDYLAQKAPMERKLGFDNVGMLVGRADREVQTVLIALDITDEVIEEAIQLSAQVIVSHHPLFFELKAVSNQNWQGERVLRLAEHGIAAICMHTNLDAAEGGVNDALLAALGGKYAGELDPETMIGRASMACAIMTLAALSAGSLYAAAPAGENSLWRMRPAAIPM